MSRAFHLRAVRLPDGERPEDWWVFEGRLHDRPVPGAQELAGGWFCQGLVDAHMHLSLDFAGFRLAPGSEALIEANLAACRAAGVLFVRDAGVVPGVTLRGAPHGPQVQWSGDILAPPGRFHAHMHRPAPAEELVTAALSQVERGASWVKIIADFPGPDGDYLVAPPTYPPELVRRLVREVHAAGARVLAHTSGPFVSELVRAGVDSIEHGTLLSAELLPEMAARGIAWTPTLGTVAGHLEPLTALPGPAGDAVRALLDRWAETLPLAVQLGVPVLAGTDELPQGELWREVAALRRFGLSPAAALAAATTVPAAYLGLPGLEAGRPAHLVTFDADPRLDPAVLGRPAAVLFGGSPAA
jgi:imidazolonepropionase-like amidohydrolase